MDMFLLFVVIFLCVMFGLGAGALTLSLLFKLMVRLAGARVAVVPAAVPSQSPRS